MSITVWPLHCTIEKAVPSASLTPYIANANMIAIFHGPNPPFEGIAILIELSTNATKQGVRPAANPGVWHNVLVKSNA